MHVALASGGGRVRVRVAAQVQSEEAGRQLAKPQASAGRPRRPDRRLDKIINNVIVCCPDSRSGGGGGGGGGANTLTCTSTQAHTGRLAVGALARRRNLGGARNHLRARPVRAGKLARAAKWAAEANGPAPAGRRVQRFRGGGRGAPCHRGRLARRALAARLHLRLSRLHYMHQRLRACCR